LSNLYKYLKNYLTFSNYSNSLDSAKVEFSETTNNLNDLLKFIKVKKNIKELEDDLNNLVHILYNTENVDAVHVFFYNKLENSFLLEISTESDVKNLTRKIKVNDLVFSELIIKRNITVFNGKEKISARLKYRKSFNDIETIVTFPLIIKDKIFGAIIVESRDPERFKKKNLSPIAFAVNFIQNRIERYVDNVLNRTKSSLIQAFLEVHEIISKPNKKEEVYSILVSLFTTIFDCDRIIFSSLDLSKEKTKIEKVYGKDNLVTERQIIDGYSAIQRAVIDNKEPLYVEDIKSDLIFDRSFNIEGSENDSSYSLFIVPIITKNHTIGTFQLEYDREVLIDDNHFIFLKRIGIILGNVIERIQLYKKMEKMATIDYLTSLLLKREFVKILINEISRSRRNQHPLALLMIDVDNFKSINDTYGHLTGDKVLKKIAEVIKSSIRTTEYASRYAGDEFCVLLLDNDEKKAFISAERIRENVKDLKIKIYENEIYVTISIGISVLHKGITHYKKMIAEADEAMYEGRRDGRRNVTTML